MMDRQTDRQIFKYPRNFICVGYNESLNEFKKYLTHHLLNKDKCLHGIVRQITKYMDIPIGFININSYHIDYLYDVHEFPRQTLVYQIMLPEQF